jgi:hypothetical protein
VGIGNTNPSYKLDVSGSVNATSYKGDGSAITGLLGLPFPIRPYDAAVPTPVGYTRMSDSGNNWMVFMKTNPTSEYTASQAIDYVKDLTDEYCPSFAVIQFIINKGMEADNTINDAGNWCGWTMEHLGSSGTTYSATIYGLFSPEGGIGGTTLQWQTRGSPYNAKIWLVRYE